VDSEIPVKLKEIAQKYNTDKGTDHSYLPIYEQIFLPMRLDKFNMLEIGVLDGASIAMWLEYLPNANIFGMDVDRHEGLVEDSRFTYINCSQSDVERVPTLFANDSLDIVIDDGSHFAEDQILSLHLLWKALKPGGLYFIEDIQTAPPYWRNGITYWSQYCPYTHLCSSVEVLDRRSILGRHDDILVVLKKK